MTKKIAKLFAAFTLTLLSVCCFVACGEDPTDPVPPGDNGVLNDFTTIVFNDETLVYDGNEHTILATGAPAGASVEYINNGPFTNAGEYTIGVKVTAEGYNDYETTAVLTINKAEFTGISFSNKSYTYSGVERTLLVTGQIPAGTSVQYSNNSGTNAGEYDASVVLSNSNYNTKTLSAKLTINKAEFSGIKFESKTYNYTGSEIQLLISGQVPSGTEVIYNNNRATNAGEYNASVTLKNSNYVDKVLTAKLTIINIVNTAKNLIDKILVRPDAWSFMPAAFNESALACKTNPVIDFSTQFVDVDDISKKFIGKQMYVLWEGVYELQNFLAYFDSVYAVGETIASAYQLFINNNPDDYSIWQATVAGFKLKIELEGSKATLLAGNNLASIELSVDSDENINEGRIQLANNAVAKYQMTDEALDFTMSLSIAGVATMKQIHFERNENVVSGYFYEYTGTGSAALKTSAVIAFNNELSVVMSSKRESSDLLIEGYEEVYSSTTGQFISAEVLENNKIVDYDTYWVNIYDVAGINTIKAIGNGQSIDPSKNQHDIYVNGSSNTFVPEYNKILGLKTSRHFDIEMKEVYYVIEVTEGNKTTYQTVKTEIPMLFIQEENVSDFATEVVKNNDYLSSVALPINKIQIAEQNYSTLRTFLDSIKELVTYDELVQSLGTKNSFFN